jgi:hypothetical protein
MALTTGISAVCQAWTGGGKKLYLIDKADITSFTLSGGIYTVCTPASGKVFKEYAFFDDSFDWKEDSNRNTESGSTKITNTLEMMFQGKNNTLRLAIEEMIASSTCGMIAIVEDNNDTKWVIGYGERSKRALKMSTGAGSIGKLQDDMVGTTITLTNDTLELARVFTGTVPV